MIKVKEEISSYKPLGMDASLYEYSVDAEIKTALQGFNKVLKRIDKKQYRYSHQLDEILDVLDQIEEGKKTAKVPKERQSETERELNSLLKAVLDIADSLEDIYLYSIRYGEKPLKEQMSMQWKRVGNLLNQYGITRLEGVGTPFIPTIYVAKAVEEKQEIPHGQILEVLRCGYLYKGKLLRKGEVIVSS